MPDIITNILVTIIVGFVLAYVGYRFLKLKFFKGKDKDTRSYNEILVEFKKARQWLESLEINVLGTRFHLIERDLEDLVVVAKTKEFGKFADPDEWRAGAYGLLEAVDLIRIHRAYGKKNGPQLRRTLKLALKGPRSGSDETTRNNKARNMLAELSWGALLELSKYSTSVEYDPDILQFVNKVEGSSIIWEVKCPLSLNNLPKRLKDGADQIEEAMLGYKNVGNTTPIGGCIVIIVDEIFGVKRPFLRALSKNDANHRLQLELKNWWRDNKRLLDNCRRRGVLGVVLWWRLLGDMPNKQGTLVFTDFHQHLLDDKVGAPDDWKLDFLRTVFKRIHL